MFFKRREKSKDNRKKEISVKVKKPRTRLVVVLIKLYEEKSLTLMDHDL